MDLSKKLNGLDLFSGIGGISYALQDWVRSIAYCEIEPYCQSVLLSRMQEGDLSKAPIWDDVRTLPYDELPGIDIIYGGFPCQDISVAGAGKGLEGERSGLFFEIMRLAKEIEPTFVFLENVPAITGRGGLRVVREITSLGYDCRWCVISASGVGALHRRERWFLLANSQPKRLERYSETREKKEPKLRNESFADGCNTFSGTSEQASESAIALYKRREAWREHSGFYRPFKSRDDWQETVSEMGKCTNGLPYQVDRLKSLGNAVVPQQVRQAWQILTGIEYQ